MSTIRLSHSRVCVKVKRNKHKLELCDDGLYMLPAETILCPLPENDIIVDRDGLELNASGRFYITAETIDPYHLAVDLF